jgi:hypothetical protein
MGPQEKDSDLISDLEGSTVLFTLEDDGGYRPSFVEGEGDGDLLEGLYGSMDLAEILPGHEVAVDDSWELPIDLMRQLLQPAGDLSLHVDDSQTSEFDIGIHDLVDALGGEFTAVYGGTREEDGVRVAVIKLQVEAHAAKDMSERSEEMVQAMQENLPPGYEIELSAFDVEFSYDAEGELYWSLERGMVHAMNLTGNVTQVLDINMSFGNSQERHSMIQSMTMGGNMTLTMTAGE